MECCILNLPPELLCAIFAYVTSSPAKPRDLAAWCLTCSTFNSLCDEEQRCRCRCFAASPVLFGLGLSPLFGGPLPVSPPPLRPPPGGKSETLHLAKDQPAAHEETTTDEAGLPPVKLTWRLRAQLLPHLPQRLNEPELNRLRAPQSPLVETEQNADGEGGRGVVDRATGRLFSNWQGGTHNLIADHPFVCTNRTALLSAFWEVQGGRGEGEEGEAYRQAKERQFLAAVMFRGVDYFEMKVVHNTKAWNRAAAIAISRWFRVTSFLGWTSQSIAYHSDDGTIRGGAECTVDYLKRFSTGDVVGCGVDWEANEVFFVLKPAPNEDAPQAETEAEVHVSNRTRTLEDTAWYPAIAAMEPNDMLRVNFGQEPFVFDVKAFVEQKRANPRGSSTASSPPHVIASPLVMY